MPPAILVENVSKCYRIAGARAVAPSRSLQEDLHQLLTSWRAARPSEGAASSRSFWALRDISFAVHPGEVVGILGRNGAGKSTLLKIVSRITRPTSGRVTIRGRLGTLLEVGAGFNPELTGRENVHLYGAILGMSRAEVARKFDAIVAFAEIAEFLETPVKRYSSGMYMRLAFAVAAHLEPDVLIVDEVLAVGDASFQQKCQAKIKSLVRDEGRTILLVTHHPGTARELCHKALFLHQGQALHFGDVEGALRLYNAADTIVVDEAGEVCLPALTWVEGSLEGPALTTTGGPITVSRAYRIASHPVPTVFSIMYFASFGRVRDESDVFIGRELIKDVERRAVGLHQGVSPPLTIGRPGRQYVLAILDHEETVLKQEGPSAVAVTSEAVAVEGPVDLTIDNGDPGYFEVGRNWHTSNRLGGFGGDYRYCASGSGAECATWQFRGLPAGHYAVEATWVPYGNRATNASYRLHDGLTLMSSVCVNQRDPPQTVRAEDSSGKEAPFQRLGVVVVTAGSLTVTLANDADDYVIADAVRIRDLGPDETGPGKTPQHRAGTEP